MKFGLTFRRRATLLAGLAALGLTLSGASAKDLTITTWTATSPGLQDWWKVIEKAYEAKHPGVDVKVENVAFADYIRTLTTRLIAGSPPSLIHVPLPTINLPAWGEAGFLEAVDDRIAGTDIKTAWPANQTAMAWKGKNYGVLLVQYGFVFFYNGKMFDEAGLKVPKNKDELLTTASRLTRNGKYGFAVTDDNTVNFMRDALQFVTGFGAEWRKDGKWNLTDPKVVAAIELWRELAVKHSPKGTDINAKRQAYYDGNVAMMIENPSLWPNVAAAAKPDLLPHLHLAPMPLEVVPGDVSHGLSIPSGLDKATEDLTWDFVALAASPEMMRAYVELVKNPVARPGVDEALKATPDTKEIADAAARAVVIIPNDYYGVRARYADFSAEMTNTLRTILEGRTPTREALVQLEGRLNAKGIAP